MIGQGKTPQHQKQPAETKEHEKNPGSGFGLPGTAGTGHCLDFQGAASEGGDPRCACAQTKVPFLVPRGALEAEGAQHPDQAPQGHHAFSLPLGRRLWKSLTKAGWSARSSRATQSPPEGAVVGGHASSCRTKRSCLHTARPRASGCTDRSRILLVPSVSPFVGLLNESQGEFQVRVYLARSRKTQNRDTAKPGPAGLSSLAVDVAQKGCPSVWWI